jgi:tetratricopeptide (TPR) repeat protein
MQVKSCAPALVLLLTCCLSAANWVIVRTDGSKIECRGLFAVVDGQYLYQDAAGNSRSLLASEVDDAQTKAANRALNNPPDSPMQSQPARASTPTQEAAYAEALQVQQMLESRHFGELTKLLAAKQAAFERDTGLDAALLDAFALFASKRPEFGPALEEWVSQMPDSWFSYAARGIYFAGQGWASRGTAFAGRTSAQQFSDMNSFFVRAGRDLRKSVAMRPNIVAYYELIRMAKADSESQITAEGYLSRALELCPACFELRRQYMVGLEPRWGGSYQKMRQFATEAQRMAGVNPQLRILEGMPYYDQSNSACSDGRGAEAVDLGNKALSYGEYWGYYRQRAMAFRCSKRYQEALQDLDRAIILRPAKADLYVEKAVCHAVLGDYATAWRDLDSGRVFPGEEGRREQTERWLRGFAPRPASR